MTSSHGAAVFMTFDSGLGRKQENALASGDRLTYPLLDDDGEKTTSAYLLRPRDLVCVAMQLSAL